MSIISIGSKAGFFTNCASTVMGGIGYLVQSVDAKATAEYMGSTNPTMAAQLLEKNASERILGAAALGFTLVGAVKLINTDLTIAERLKVAAVLAVNAALPYMIASSCAETVDPFLAFEASSAVLAATNAFLMYLTKSDSLTSTQQSRQVNQPK